MVSTAFKIISFTSFFKNSCSKVYKTLTLDLCTLLFTVCWCIRTTTAIKTPRKLNYLNVIINVRHRNYESMNYRPTIYLYYLNVRHCYSYAYSYWVVDM